jgi:hypothetical protein
MAKLKREEEKEDVSPIVKYARTAIDQDQAFGGIMPLADLDVYLATQCLPADATYCLAAVCRALRARIPLPALSLAMASAIVNGRGPIRQWLNAYHGPSSSRAWPILTGVAEVDTDVRKALQLRDYASRGDTPCPRVSRKVPYLFAERMDHPLYHQCTTEQTLLDMMVDFARRGAPLAVAHDYFYYIHHRHVDYGEHIPSVLHVFNAMLRTGCLDYATFFHGPLPTGIEGLSPLGESLFCAALGGKRMLKHFVRHYVGGPARYEPEWQISRPEVLSIAKVFLTRHAELSDKVMRYFVEHVYKDDDYNEVNLHMETVLPTDLWALCPPHAYGLCLDMLFARPGSGTADSMDWIKTLLSFMAIFPEDKRIWAHLEYLASCEEIYAVLFDPPERFLSLDQWKRVMRTWPYRFQTIPSFPVGKTTPPMDALELQAMHLFYWFAVVPYGWVTDWVGKQWSLEWWFSVVPRDLLDTTPLLPWSAAEVGDPGPLFCTERVERLVRRRMTE